MRERSTQYWRLSGSGGTGCNPGPTRFNSLGKRPMIARSTVTLLSYSLRVAISCATIWSYFACASFVSVIVATPTSKLRFACASDSTTAFFWLSASSMLNWASSTSK